MEKTKLTFEEEWDLVYRMPTGTAALMAQEKDWDLDKQIEATDFLWCCLKAAAFAEVCVAVWVLFRPIKAIWKVKHRKKS